MTVIKPENFPLLIEFLGFKVRHVRLCLYVKVMAVCIWIALAIAWCVDLWVDGVTWWRVGMPILAALMVRIYAKEFRQGRQAFIATRSALRCLVALNRMARTGVVLDVSVPAIHHQLEQLEASADRVRFEISIERHIL